MMRRALRTVTSRQSARSWASNTSLRRMSMMARSFKMEAGVRPVRSARSITWGSLEMS